MRVVWIAAIISVCGAQLAAASTLVIYSNASDPAPRSAWEDAIQRFKSENPDVDTRFNVFDHESYKKEIRNWLTSEPPETEASATISSIEGEIVNSNRPCIWKAVESVVVLKLRLPAATRCNVCEGRLTVTILNPPPLFVSKLPVVVLTSSV